MASLNYHGNTPRIQFKDLEGRWRTLRLGKVDRRTAEAATSHLEAILSARRFARPLPKATEAWLAEIPTELRDKLAKLGLIEAPKVRLTVAAYLAEWLAAKETAGYKPTSLRAWGQTAAALEARFGSVHLVDLTHAHGVQLTAAMQRAGLRPTTIHKRLGHARAMLEDAERLGHVTTNPWRHVRHSSGDPSERRTYVPVAAVQRVIEAAPNVWWRLLIALARHAGCRIPSEAFSLTWGDVDWSRSRIVIRSPKGERSGKGLRTIPLFPCLRPILEEALEAADPDEIHVFPAHFRHRAGGPMGFDGANLRTTLAQIVRRAGLEPWPRIWHALRASLESDLAHSFALATVTKWLGNTPSVALRHYVDPTDQAFEAAILWRPPDGDVNSTSAVPKMPRDGNPTQSVATDYERIKDPEKTDKSNDRNPSQCEAINTPSRKRTAPERPRASSFATRTATASVAPTKRA